LNISKTLNTWEVKKEAYYKWFYELTWVKKSLFCLGMATITGICAQIRIPLPFTPVPITGQVLTVLLAGVLLGRLYGGLSMLLYLLLGSAGVPWFAGASGGLPIGPTAGYIVGFIPAALFIGWATQRYHKTHQFLPLIGLMMIAVFIIYFFGAVNFALLMKTDFSQTIGMAVIPFIPGDFFKALMAASIARVALPRRSL